MKYLFAIGHLQVTEHPDEVYRLVKLSMSHQVNGRTPKFASIRVGAPALATVRLGSRIASERSIEFALSAKGR
jgi:hypothetical protein